MVLLTVRLIANCTPNPSKNPTASFTAGSSAADRLKFQEASQQAQLQLQALKNQIDLMTKRVDLESEVFTIASDTASLQAESNELNLEALQKTIQGWKDLKTLIASIYQNPDGTFGLNTAGLTPAAGPQTNLNFGSGAIVINATGDVNGANLAQQMLDALSKERSSWEDMGANVWKQLQTKAVLQIQSQIVREC